MRVQIRLESGISRLHTAPAPGIRLEHGVLKMISGNVESPGQQRLAESGDALPGNRFFRPLTRRGFWLAIIVLEALNLVVEKLLSIEERGQFFSFFSAAIVVAIAWVVGARFRDAGRPRWLGVTMVFVITFFLPLVLGITVAAGFIPGLRELLASIGIPGRGVLAMLVILYVIAGTPPSRSAAVAACRA